MIATACVCAGPDITFVPDALWWPWLIAIAVFAVSAWLAGFHQSRPRK